MPAVAWFAPSVSSSPVDQPSSTSELTALDSRTVNDSAEPSVADAASTDTGVSSSLIVPTAVSVPMITPAGSVVPVMVTLRVSSVSTDASSVVCTVNVAVVSPAVMVTLPLVTAV